MHVWSHFSSWNLLYSNGNAQNSKGAWVVHARVLVWAFLCPSLLHHWGINCLVFSSNNYVFLCVWLSANAHTHCLLLNHQLPIQHPFMNADTEWLSPYWKLFHIGQLFSASPAPLAFRRNKMIIICFFCEREKISLDYLHILQTNLHLPARLYFFCLPWLRVWLLGKSMIALSVTCLN